MLVALDSIYLQGATKLSNGFYVAGIWKFSIGECYDMPQQYTVYNVDLISDMFKVHFPLPFWGVGTHSFIVLSDS